MISVFEPGDTKQFTFQSSVAPDSAPSFAVYDSSESLVGSVTSQQSNATHYYAMFTMPTSADGLYVAEWTALSTVSTVGSAFSFKKRSLFNVVKTRSNL